MNRFETLDIWNEAINYGVNVYKLTKNFPKDELYSLTNQLRRAAVSISSNIAEGSGSDSKKDFQKFLDIAAKSTLETISQILFAIKLEYTTKLEVSKLLESATILTRRIYAFRNSLDRTP
ncbi:MAG: four helix bundle protein [bacterium]